MTRIGEMTMVIDRYETSKAFESFVEETHGIEILDSEDLFNDDECRWEGTVYTMYLSDFHKSEILPKLKDLGIKLEESA